MKHQSVWIVGVVLVGLAVFGGLGWIGWSTYYEQNKDRWAQEKKDREEKAEADRRAAVEAAALLEQRKVDTRNQVESFAEKLHGDISGDNKYKYNHFEGDAPQDSWGHSLVIRYKTTGYVWKGEAVTVISAGPDGKIDTGDDITAERKTR